ncbi:MAG TPA: EAL domain-containing protein [Bradyrhizobium sp.]|uniref:EAL domain-containing protein n=1 Tax=Bradyrhizobium sp. TaxID=376 RepID=UPI002C4C2D59|nr:EAL domain-containing protein [Bradyrhizobium sp.]HLZ06039.1 EAL domain-containing protein [Bradyrhizobium sp.]
MATVVASMAVFAAGGHFVAQAIIGGQEQQRLQELTEIALRRSEVAVDFAAASVDELASIGKLDCEPTSLQQFRLQAYQRSAVKDVRLVNHDGSIVCSAYSETLEFDKDWVTRRDMLATSDDKLRLFRVEQFGGDALGVLRDVDPKRGLVAIIGINSYLFDIMPAELRAHSEVVLALNNDQQLAQFSLENLDLQDPIELTKTSSRYPLHATIRVESSALARAYGHGYWPGMLAALGLGLAFGVLLTRALRVEGPLADLDQALARAEFRPFFQPIFHLATGEILGCEMLARWIRADGSIVPPMKFIPLAEQSGRIRVMTWQILAIALKELNAHLRHSKEFKLSFNVVPSHLMSEGFVEQLRRTVADAKVSARQIVLEITERDELQDLGKAAEIVRDLREFGFKVAIDDVGVGHSGLSHLKALGANTMKIDKFFVDTIKDESTSRIVETLVRLARDLQMTVVAEGIETDQQMQSLLACGVEEGQGYIVSPPLPCAKFIELMQIRQARFTAKSIVDDAALVA